MIILQSIWLWRVYTFKCFSVGFSHSRKKLGWFSHSLETQAAAQDFYNKTWAFAGGPKIHAKMQRFL